MRFAFDLFFIISCCVGVAEALFAKCNDQPNYLVTRIYSFGTNMFGTTPSFTNNSSSSSSSSYAAAATAATDEIIPATVQMAAVGADVTIGWHLERLAASLSIQHCSSARSQQGAHATTFDEDEGQDAFPCAKYSGTEVELDAFDESESGLSAHQLVAQLRNNQCVTVDDCTECVERLLQAASR